MDNDEKPDAEKPEDVASRPRLDPDTYKTDWVAGQRPAFEEMQRRSPRRYLHVRRW